MTQAAEEPSHPLRFAVGLWRQAITRAPAVLALYAVIYLTALIGHPSPIFACALVLAELLVSAMAQGALTRLGLGLGDETTSAPGLGLVGLQWTAVETRMLLSRLLLALVLLLLLVGAVFCMALAGGVMMAVSRQSPAPSGFFQTPAGMSVVVVALVFAAATIWIMTRLALSGPATVDREQVQVFTTWTMTSGGRPWRLLFWCPALNIVVFALGFSLRTAERTGGLQGGAAIAAALAYVLFIAFVETPIATGVSVYAYRRLGSAPTA
jgi:hypothetical protein